MRVSVCRVQSRSHCGTCRALVSVEYKTCIRLAKKLVILGCFGSPGDVTAAVGSEKQRSHVGVTLRKCGKGHTERERSEQVTDAQRKPILCAAR